MSCDGTFGEIVWKGSGGVHDAGGTPKKAHVPHAPGAGVRGSAQRHAYPSATHPVPSRAAAVAASAPGRGGGRGGPRGGSAGGEGIRSWSGGGLARPTAAPGGRALSPSRVSRPAAACRPGATRVARRRGGPSWPWRPPRRLPDTAPARAMATRPGEPPAVTTPPAHQATRREPRAPARPGPATRTLQAWRDQARGLREQPHPRCVRQRAPPTGCASSHSLLAAERAEQPPDSGRCHYEAQRHSDCDPEAKNISYYQGLPCCGLSRLSGTDTKMP